MQNQAGLVKGSPAANSALMGAGAVLGSVATGMPYSPALADAVAMQHDQIAVAIDFWGSMAALPLAGQMHPGQGSLFEQR